MFNLLNFRERSTHVPITDLKGLIQSQNIFACGVFHSETLDVFSHFCVPKQDL